MDGGIGRALPDLQIVLKAYPNGQLAIEPQTSGPDGRFTFYGLPAGLYIADTWLYGEVIHYGELPDGRVLASRVGPDFENTEFTFRVESRPSIDGIVLDEFGDPVAGATVTPIQSVWADDRIGAVLQAPATTDDRGRYHIAGVPPGAYRVCAEIRHEPSGSEWFRAIAPEEASSVDFGTRGAPRFYQRSCYPAQSAAPLKAEWGRDATVNLKLGSATGTKVQGRVANWEPGHGYISLATEDGTVSVPAGKIQSDGEFEFNVLEPGRYRLKAEINGGARPSWVAQQTIVVDKTAITGLHLTPEPVGGIPVLIQSPAMPVLQPDSATIGLRSASSPTGESYWAQPASDGSSSFASVPPGRYWVVTRTQGPLCVESIRFGGRAVLHDMLSVSPGESQAMDVVLTAQCAQIEGQVIMPEHGGAYPVVELMLSGTPNSPGDVLELAGSEDGTFSVVGLPPGRYFLWAWSQDDMGFPGPKTLAEVANQATVVEVTRGQHAVAQVRPLSGLVGAK